MRRGWGLTAVEGRGRGGTDRTSGSSEVVEEVDGEEFGSEEADGGETVGVREAEGGGDVSCGSVEEGLGGGGWMGVGG